MGFYVVTKNGATILRRTYKVIYKIAYIVAQGHIRTRFFLHRSSFWWYFITKRKTIRCKQRGKPQGSSDPSKTCHSLILTLTKKETATLEYLLLHQGRPVSSEELIDHVWDNSVDSFSNSIRVHISSLRKKLKDKLGYDPIINRIGEGYLIKETIWKIHYNGA